MTKIEGNVSDSETIFSVHVSPWVVLSFFVRLFTVHVGGSFASGSHPFRVQWILESQDFSVILIWVEGKGTTFAQNQN